MILVTACDMQSPVLWAMIMVTICDNIIGYVQCSQLELFGCGGS